MSLEQSRPWLALGISRATWFRRQKERGETGGRTGRPVASKPVIDVAISRNEFLNASESEVARVRAKLAAIGPGGAVITKTDGRFDVVSSATFEARNALQPSHVPPPRPTPPPKSMYAIGGKPGRGLIPQGRGMPLPPDLAAVSAFSHAKEFEAQTTAVIAELVARDKDKERRMAALEAAAADRRALAAEAGQAFLNVIGYFAGVR